MTNKEFEIISLPLNSLTGTVVMDPYLFNLTLDT